jgi:hypothetical protein
MNDRRGVIGDGRRDRQFSGQKPMPMGQATAPPRRPSGNQQEQPKPEKQAAANANNVGGDIGGGGGGLMQTLYGYAKKVLPNAPNQMKLPDDKEKTVRYLKKLNVHDLKQNKSCNESVSIYLRFRSNLASTKF